MDSNAYQVGVASDAYQVGVDGNVSSPCVDSDDNELPRRGHVATTLRSSSFNENPVCDAKQPLATPLLAKFRRATRITGRVLPWMRR